MIFFWALQRVLCKGCFDLLKVNCKQNMEFMSSFDFMLTWYHNIHTLFDTLQKSSDWRSILIRKNKVYKMYTLMQSYLFTEAHCRNYNGRWNTIFMLQVTEQHFLHITNINITLFHAAEQGMKYSHGFTRFFFAISSIVFSNWIKVREGYFFDSNSCSTKIVCFIFYF